MGDGNSTSRTIPVQAKLPANRTATSLALGLSHTCALLDDGNISCWGDNGYGKAPSELSMPGGRYAVAIAAIMPRTETQRVLMKPLLLPALESAQLTRQEPPHELLMQDQNTIQVCYGNVTALIGYHMSDSNWLTKAANAYQEVLDTTTKDADPMAWANVQLHLSRIRQGLAERSNDLEMFEITINSLREILEVYTFDDFPDS